eukprot:SAG31_NODE_377_length_16533_cov_99.867957_11_plen_56_part_00
MVMTSSQASFTNKIRVLAMRIRTAAAVYYLYAMGCHKLKDQLASATRLLDLRLAT